MPSQRMKLETPKRLRRSRFKWSGDQKFFAGWSFSPTAETLDVPDQAIFDWTQFQDRIGEMREGGELTLFAVWLDVGMGTELVLEI